MKLWHMLVAGLAGWWVFGRNRNSAAKEIVMGAAVNKGLARLDLLVPEVRDKMKKLIQVLNAKGIYVTVGTTYRSPAEQQKVYAEGKSGTSDRSWHKVRRAIDIYLRDPKSGRWITSTEDVKANKPLYETMGHEAEKLGFKWLGFEERKTSAGRSFTDPYHIQYSGGLTYAQADAQASRFSAMA